MEAGDLILYQGNSFVIYYDTNSWNFTRFGKIDHVMGQELRAILGSGDVTAVLSSPMEQYAKYNHEIERSMECAMFFSS